MFISTIFRNSNLKHNNKVKSSQVSHISPVKSSKNFVTLLSCFQGPKRKKEETKSNNLAQSRGNPIEEIIPKSFGLKSKYSALFSCFQKVNPIIVSKSLSIIKKNIATTPTKPKRTYFIIPGNNSSLIKRCLANRHNWIEGSSLTTNNLLWAPISTKVPFFNYSQFNLSVQTVNHFEYHNQLTNKSNLFYNLLVYCEKKNIDVFSFIPFTILIQYDHRNFLKQFRSFTILYSNITDYIKKNKKKKYTDLFTIDDGDKVGHKTLLYINETLFSGRNLWLVKAPNLNRGQCIKVSDSIADIQMIIKNLYNGINRKVNFENEVERKDEELLYQQNSNRHISNEGTFNLNKTTGNETNNNSQKVAKKAEKRYKANKAIIQKYIEDPLLDKGRKFDIRIWVLLTHTKELYVFKQGHLKASSELFDIKSNSTFVHLTNYSVQKYNEHFSSFEFGNEISFEEFQKELIQQKIYTSVNYEIFPKLCDIILISINAIIDKINVSERKYCFEIFGYDFMLDSKLNPYLIEVNTNPGLEESSPLINILVPRMIDDAFRLTIDTLFNDDNIKDSYISPFPVTGYKNQENMWMPVM